MSRLPRLRNTVWVFRVLLELVLKDDWSVLGSSQGRSLCSKVSLHPYLRGPWRGQDWEELRLWVWGVISSEWGVFLGGFRAGSRWLLHPPWCKSGVPGQENVFSSFDGNSEGRAEDFIILLAPKRVGGQHARGKQDQVRYLPEGVTSLGLEVHNSVWGVRSLNT